MKPDKVLSVIGIAMKSGNVVSGEFSTEKAVRSKSAALVIVASDASDNTKKKFRNMTDYYGVPLHFYSDKETLGHYIGKQFRAALAVTDEGLARSIEDKLMKMLTTE